MTTTVDSEEPPLGPYGRSSAEIRATTKWIVAAFAAVGAVAVAGLQLRDFAHVTRTGQVVAAGAFLVAVLAVGSVIVSAAAVLIPNFTSLTELAKMENRTNIRKKLAKNGNGTKKKLAKNSNNTQALQTTSAAVQVLTLPPEPTIPVLKAIHDNRFLLIQHLDQDEKTPQYLFAGVNKLHGAAMEARHTPASSVEQLHQLNEWITLLEEDADRVVDFANLYIEQSRFAKLRRALVYAGTLVAAAAIVFAMAISGTRKEVPRLATPQAVDVTLTRPAPNTFLGTGLPKTCTTPQFPAVAVGGSFAEPDVEASVPACGIARFQVTKGIGVAIPRIPTQPSPTTTVPLQHQ